jgi:hypothetical protein
MAAMAIPAGWARLLRGGRTQAEAAVVTAWTALADFEAELAAAQQQLTQAERGVLDATVK